MGFSRSKKVFDEFTNTNMSGFEEGFVYALSSI